jgi:hypothetical protein
MTFANEIRVELGEIPLRISLAGMSGEKLGDGGRIDVSIGLADGENGRAKDLPSQKRRVRYLVLERTFPQYLGLKGCCSATSASDK